MNAKWLFVFPALILLMNRATTAQAQDRQPPTDTDHPVHIQKSAFIQPASGAGSLPVSILDRPVIAAVPSPLLVNGDFEQGAEVGWNVYSEVGSNLVWPVGDLPLAPHSGGWAAWLGGDDNEFAALFQDVGIEAPATLRFWYWTVSSGGCGQDIGYVLISGYAIHYWDLCTTSNTGGWVEQTLDLSEDDGLTRSLQFRVETDASNPSSLYIDDVAIYGDFYDVTYDYWSYDWIARLYNAGITGGCGSAPLRYCPEDNVTRAQMSVFLERGIHGSGYTPPNVAPTFNDTAGSFAEDWIEALKVDGITGGCGVNLYCPEALTTRAEMAIFLLRSKYGSAYTPPPATGTMFTDVPSSYWAVNWIEQLATEGITTGCGVGLYCPDATVTRAQMSVFLVRTFSLP